MSCGTPRATTERSIDRRGWHRVFGRRDEASARGLIVQSVRWRHVTHGAPRRRPRIEAAYVIPSSAGDAVGGIVHRPAFVDGELHERQLLPLTLSFDHAVVDGAPAARFAATLRRLFETAAALDHAGPRRS